jgi:chromosome segregation ATPase
MGDRTSHATDESALEAIERIEQALDAQRSRVAAFLARHQQRMRQIEDSLVSNLSRVLEELSARECELGTAADDLAQQRVQLQTEHDRLAAERSDLQRRCEELAAADRQQQVRQAELEHDSALLQQQRDELQQLQSAIADAQQLVQQQRADLETRRLDLDQRQQQLDTLAAQLQQQHQQLESQREQFVEDARQLADGRQRLQHKLSEVDQLRQQLQAQHDDLHAQLEAARATQAQHGRQLQELQTALAQACQQRDTALQQQRALQRKLDACRSASDHGPGGSTDADEPCEVAPWRQRCIQLEQQVEALQRQLQTAQAQAAETTVATDDTGYVLEDLQRRYDMLLQDLKQERKRTGELLAELAKLRAGSAQGRSSDADGLDWEAQKRRLLQALESDLDADDPDDAQQRQRIEQTIRRTEELLAVKDREIQELQRLLQEQSAQLGHMAVGAAAVAQVLDRDEVIRQERENLARLQEEWREKLRGAEVEISLQRARLARERAQLDEKLQQYQALVEKLGAQADADTARKQGSRGNWLTRLGLRSDDSS